jgi:hypothetical protein
VQTLFFILTFLYSSGNFRTHIRQSYPYVNPTGTYILKGIKHHQEIKGPYGEIRVKLLDSSRIAISFYFNGGYPKYYSGSFIDTIQYLQNHAIYSARKDDSCNVVFSFSSSGVDLSERYSNPQATCGFPPGVSAVGYVKKYSSETPVIKDLSRSGSQ